MRVLSCKLHCPFICFCKPSPHIYTPGRLKLENSKIAPPRSVSVSDTSDKSSGDGNEGKEGNLDGNHHSEIFLKSSLRKLQHSEKQEVGKKRVQWMDFLGKELVEIKEFESSETGESDSEGEGSRSCVCVIL